MDDEKVEANLRLIGEGWAAGWFKGRRKGREEGLRIAVFDLCELMGIELSLAQRVRVEAMQERELQTVRYALKLLQRLLG
jgi:hypothetical protein